MTSDGRRFADRLKVVLRVAVVPIALALAIGAVRVASGLYEVVRRAGDVDAGLTLLDRRIDDTARLAWTEADPGPRSLERTTREWVAGDYLRALDEVTYALASGDGSGLRSYYQEASLDDARASVAARVASAAAVHTADWGHQLEATFYAPDGATVGFTDRYQYAWGRLGSTDLTAAQVGERVMQVVMTLDDGNWRIRHWRVLEDAPILVDRVLDPVAPVGFHDLRGVNYVGRSHPFGTFWDAFDAGEVAEDFERAAALGFDTVRVFVPFPAPTNIERTLPELLAAARRSGLAVVPTLFDGYTAYAIADLGAAARYLALLAPWLADASVRFVDVKNEADRDLASAGALRLRTFLGFVLAEVRRATGRPVLVGTSDPDPVLAAASDLVSLHHYGPVDALGPRIAAARRFGKPVVVEELGFHTLPTAIPDPHTEAEQSRYFATALAILREADVGWMAWTLGDLPAGAVPGGRRVERHLGLLRADGSMKPAARVLLGSEPVPATAWERPRKLAPFALVLVTTTLVAIGAIAGLRRSSRWLRAARGN